MTLIEVRDSSGLVGRCDARCYGGNPAGVDRCDCVCEGLNHGIGLDAALNNVSRIVQEWRELAGGGVFSDRGNGSGQAV